MNKKKLLVSVKWMTLLCLIFVSCEKRAVENQQDMINLKVQAQETQLSLIDDITLELPKTGPALGLVGSIVVVENYIIILDGLRKSIDVFDREGNYKWSVGSRGGGKGQYKIPREPTIIPNTDQMLIYDGGTGQILRFSIKGEFLGQVKLSEKRFINRMLVSEDHHFIHTYAEANKNGMLCVTSLDTGKDLAKFKISDDQYDKIFGVLGRLQGITYDKAQGMIYFALPWEEKVMRIDLTTQDFLASIAINHPKFISVKVNEGKTGRELLKDKFSRLSGMYLLSSGDMLLRYLFNDSSNSTALILLSELLGQPSVQELKNEFELGRNVFTCHGQSVYMYSPPSDDGDTNGIIRVYRLTESQRSPTG